MKQLPMNYQKLCFLYSGSPRSKEAFDYFSSKYENHDLNEAEVVVTLGGDGFLLEVLRKHPELSLPIFAMNRGTLGFLLNEYKEENLLERINESNEIFLTPLNMEAHDRSGKVHRLQAFNEVSAIRYSAQSANLEIKVDGIVALEHLSCDGIMVATPAGSTAYNLSAHGPIIPLSSNLLALTPVSPFRPRRWKGALLPNNVVIEIKNLDAEKRPLGAAADSTEVKEAVYIKVWQEPSDRRKLLFDKSQSLEERILKEQFNV